MADTNIACDFCKISSRKLAKSQFRNVSGESYSDLRKHIQITHDIVVENYMCLKHIVTKQRDMKQCTNMCCQKVPPERKNAVSVLCPKCDSSCSKDCDSSSKSEKPNSAMTANQCPIKTVSKTNSRCVICRQLVKAGCANIPKEAQIDFLIRYQTLLPDKARICKKHLIGKHLKTDIKPMSVEKNVMSNEKMQQALTLLLSQRDTKTSPINFDGEMNYHTWTGI